MHGPSVRSLRGTDVVQRHRLFGLAIEYGVSARRPIETRTQNETILIRYGETVEPPLSPQ